MTTSEMIAVMQAYVDGKAIELSKDGETWEGLGSFEPSWDWSNFDYRVKPEPKYVPYDSVSEVDEDKWVKSKYNGVLKRISALDANHNSVYILGWYDLKQLFELFTYKDGTPCGKLVK